MATISLALFAAASIGMSLYAIQWVSLRRHLRMPQLRPRRAAAISILKPLCGLDDDLMANIERFATLDYPHYELLLGVRSAADTAYPLARAAAARWPGRVRVVLQRGEPGMNPKVNQLITLAAAARHSIVVVSDSNVSVERDYLSEIAAHLEDPTVGLVTHAVVGVGELRLGSLCDNMHMAASVGAGMIGAKRVAHQDVVVGKSMALRRSDLKRLGGFEIVADILAEDYFLGKMISSHLGKRVVMANRPVHNVSRQRCVRDFLRRYQRWSVLHRQSVGPYLYTAQLMLNPLALAMLGFAAAPSQRSLACLGAFWAGKTAYDCAAVRALRGDGVGLRGLFATPVKDLLIGVAWVHGLTHRRVEWRSNRLRVLAGTRIERPIAIAAESPTIARAA